MTRLHNVAFVILIIGGLNVFLEAFDTGLGSWLGDDVTHIAYIIIGLAAVAEVATHRRHCKSCEPRQSQSPQM